MILTREQIDWLSDLWSDNDPCPVEIVLHCHDSVPMYLLAVRGTVKTAYRGVVEKVENFDVDPAKIEAARAWCSARGIEWKDPSWLLVSYWG